MPADLDSAVKTVVDPAAHADLPRLHEAYSWLRRNAPIARADIDGFDPFYVVTKHADILEISRNNARFPYGGRPSTLTTSYLIEQSRANAAAGQPAMRTLVAMDEPDHMKYRALTQAWFMPQNVRKLEGRIRELAREAVARMVSFGDACDFVNEVALHYPLRVIMEILGVPEADVGLMLRLTQELFGYTDPDLQRKADSGDLRSPAERGKEALMEFFSYFTALTQSRQANPVGDVASVIANAQIDGQQISTIDAISYYLIIATAGHDTTSASTAGAMWALAERPDELAKVKADHTLIPSLVDESIRWTTPVRHFMRSVSEDTEVRGQSLAKGEWLMLCYPSGNRDEEVFEDPFAFRVDRKPNPHLAFGYGAHLCLGQHLAKMEMRILWEELLPRLAYVNLDGVARLSQANFVSGPKTLPIRYAFA